MEYGCIGEKLGHSFSKEIHNAIADYEYELKEVSRDDFDHFMKAKDFKAINVTIPYKEMVIPYLDEIDERARQIGAVNTIVNRDGKLYGYNTDFYGMDALIKKLDYSLKDKKVAILGTGGTSKTAKAVAESQGAKEILFVSRTKREGVITYEELKERYNYVDAIINTTPFGMYPNMTEDCLSLIHFGYLEAVVDVIYNPLRTRLVVEARERGRKATGGLYMLVAQAVRASEIFLNQKYNDDKIDEIYTKLVKEKENIVLIGMPGAGKSTVAKILAEKMNRQWIDTDPLIEKKTGMTIAEIFREKGELQFRNLETEVIEEISSLNGMIIATGGGVPLRNRNMELLKENGYAVFLDRPLDDLIPTVDRPLASKKTDIEKLYYTRMPSYFASADLNVKINSDQYGVAKQIINSLDQRDL